MSHNRRYDLRSHHDPRPSSSAPAASHVPPEQTGPVLGINDRLGKNGTYIFKLDELSIKLEKHRENIRRILTEHDLANMPPPEYINGPGAREFQPSGQGHFYKVDGTWMRYNAGQNMQQYILDAQPTRRSIVHTVDLKPLYRANYNAVAATVHSLTHRKRQIYGMNSTRTANDGRRRF